MIENDLSNLVDKNVIVTTDEGTIVGMAVGLDTQGNLELIRINPAIGGKIENKSFAIQITEIVSCEVIE